ncbi:hypothetical protein, partial [Salmonella enterica]|uniref:hypothetical protein n=1 Tax=Salmonella enterica TaxID=28901 RepID=UPI00139CABCB
AAGADHFVVSGIAGGVAGSTGGVTVVAVDADNNTTPTYTGTVHFTSSDAHAVLPADYTFVSGDNGTHTFGGITLVTAGSQSVTATDTVFAAVTGTQSGIVVTAAGATSLTVVGIASGVANDAASATVTARDPYGNPALSYVGTVHF